MACACKARVGAQERDERAEEAAGWVAVRVAACRALAASGAARSLREGGTRAVVVDVGGVLRTVVAVVVVLVRAVAVEIVAVVGLRVRERGAWLAGRLEREGEEGEAQEREEIGWRGGEHRAMLAGGGEEGWDAPASRGGAVDSWRVVAPRVAEPPSSSCSSEHYYSFVLRAAEVPGRLAPGRVKIAFPGASPSVRGTRREAWGRRGVAAVGVGMPGHRAVVVVNGCAPADGEGRTSRAGGRCACVRGSWSSFGPGRRIAARARHVAERRRAPVWRLEPEA